MATDFLQGHFTVYAERTEVPGRLAVAAKTAQAVVAFGGTGGDLGKYAAGTGDDADLLGYDGPPRPPAPDPEVPEPGNAVDEHHHLLAAHEAKRFNLHQPQLPGERRADGEDAHRHLRMAMPKLQPGVFLGYRMAPGGRWNKEYIVADLQESVHTFYKIHWEQLMPSQYLP